MNPKNKNLLFILIGTLILFIGIKIGLEIKCARNKNFSQASETFLKTSTKSEVSDKKDYYSDLEKYGGEVLQLGGRGSKIHQATAHLLGEHGYLAPPEDWITVFFNTPVDLLTVGCKTGYKVSSCAANEGSFIDDQLGCRTTLGDQIKNTVSVTCIKK